MVKRVREEREEDCPHTHHALGIQSPPQGRAGCSALGGRGRGLRYEEIGCLLLAFWVVIMKSEIILME